MGDEGMTMIRWEDRRFDFGFPVEMAPLLLERLRGTPARVADRVLALSQAIRTLRDDGKWSIQEHAGHLIDVESLFLGRLDDYDAGATRLRAADMSGRRTSEANYNQEEMSVIVARFREARARLVNRLEGLDAAGYERSAIHPRLDRPMRVCDMMLFEAEHDDYHLARITQLIRRDQTGGLMC
jgi:uncharacterized damage-inducible protein DinB